MSDVFIETPVLYDNSLGSGLDVNLPTNISKTIKQQPLTNKDFEDVVPRNPDTFGDSLTTTGDFYTFKNEEKSIIKKISYRIINSGRSLTLTPIVLSNSFDWNLQSIQFNFPSYILPHCVTISSQSQDILVIDVLTDINVFITLKVNVNSFFKGDSGLSYANIYKWLNYSMPYSFDTRIPLSFRAIDNLTIIISLKDGGLLKFSREQSFGKALIIPFTDSSSADTFRFNFFRSRNKTPDQDDENALIPDFIDFNGTDNVSTKAVLDCVAKDQFLFTVSINKCIKVWNIQETKFIKKIKLNDHLTNDLHPLLFNIPPTNLLSLIDNTLIIFLPIEAGIIKFFIIDESFGLTEQASINPANIQSNWLFQNFKITKLGESYRIWISWCFNKARMIQKCDILADGQITWTTIHSSEDIIGYLDNEFHQFINSNISNDDINTYSIDFIFDKFNYSQIVLTKVVELFNKIYKLDLSKRTLKDQILTVITYEDDLKKQWTKFNNTCKELEKTLNETVNMDTSFDEKTNNEDFVVIMKALDYSLIRKTSDVEQLTYNEFKNQDMNSLIQLGSSFAKYFTDESLFEIKRKLITSNTPISDIFNELIADQINQQIVSDLLSSLNSIPNAFSLIQKLIKLPIDNSGYKTVQNVEFGIAGESILSSTLRSQLYFIQSQLFNIILIFLTVDNNDQTLKIYNELLANYKKIEFGLEMFREDDIIIGYLRKVYQGNGILLRFNNLNSVLTDALNWIAKDYFLYYSLSELIKSEKPEKALELINLFPVSNEKNPLKILIKGLALLTLDSQKAFEWFDGSADLILNTIDEVDELDRAVTDGVSDNLRLILVPDKSKVTYYYNLSLVFQSFKCDLLSLQLVLKALSTKNKLKDDSDDQLILLKIFKLSTKLSEFQLAYENILKMRETKDRRQCIRTFIFKLFQGNQISRLLEFEFHKDFDAVDSLIFELAEKETLENQNYLNSVKYYRINYSLRLKEGDFRSAMEALYRFNVIVTTKEGDNATDEVKKIVEENYLIILNLMNTMAEHDQWIIKQKLDGASAADELVDLNGLEKEAALRA